MSESREAPRIQLQGRQLLPAPIYTHWSCEVCNFPARAVSERGVSAAMDAHQAFVNSQLDRATDPHFAELRMDRLIQA